MRRWRLNETVSHMALETSLDDFTLYRIRIQRVRG